MCKSHFHPQPGLDVDRRVPAFPHSMNQRCACWLLEVRERVQADSFRLTHEFIVEIFSPELSKQIDYAKGSYQEWSSR